MATTIATVNQPKVYALELFQHLILRLCQGDDEAKQALLKNVPRFKRVLKELGDVDLFSHMLVYIEKFGKLPSLNGFYDFVSGSQQSSGMQFTIDEIRETVAAGEDQPMIQDINVLIEEVIEQARRNAMHSMMKIATQISVTGWDDKQDHNRKWQGVQAAQDWLSLHLPYVSDEYVNGEEVPLEDGEVELLSGRDGASTFTIVGLPADSVPIEPLTWLWPDRFPKDATSIIAGKADCGKSQVVLDIVSRTTTGNDWPDGAKNINGPRKVVMFISEDDIRKVVKPRLVASGADTSKIIFVPYIRIQEFKEEHKGKSERVIKAMRVLQLSEDIKKLKVLLKSDPGIGLVVFDALTSYLGEVNMNDNIEMRTKVFDPLAKLLSGTDVCFLGIMHHSKKSDADAIEKILGAGSITASVRAAYAISRDPENKGEFHFALVKGNLTKKRGGMKGRYSEAKVGSGEAAKIEWISEIDEDANEVMAQNKEARGEKKVDKAKLLLQSMLADGPRPSQEVVNAGKAEGISYDQIQRAKKALGVKSIKSGDDWTMWLSKAIEKDLLVDEAVM
jgi:RecA-family ATPase